MARAKHTYAVRLAVEGGGKVKAELVQVGETGDRSLRKIETASGKASRGLLGLGDRTKALGLGIKALGGALAGVVAAGGLTALIDRSISAADAIGKTADKIGVGVEALQELRYAAQSAGIEERTLDMALQRFTRRAAEAAKGTGEAKDALSQMGIALRDQSGHMRRTEDLLGDVAEAFRAIEDPAERVRLAFKLFDSEGVAMVNMLGNGADRLEEMRARARDLGIVLEEDLVRDAERARNELDTLGRVISANVSRAVLDLAPLIADLSGELAQLASGAGVAYEQLKLLAFGDFNFEGLSLHATRRIVEDKREQLKDIAREINELGEVSLIENPLKKIRALYLQRRLEEELQIYRQWSAKLAHLQNQAEKDRAKADDNSTADAIEADIAAAKDRAAALVKIETDLQNQLFEATHTGAKRIKAEHEKRVAELGDLAGPDGGDTEKVNALIAQSAALRDAQLARLAQREHTTTAQRIDTNQRLIASLQAEREELTLVDRERFVSQALRRLSATATDAERQQVAGLAGALYDEQEAQEVARKAADERNRQLEAGRRLTERLRTAEEAYKDEIAELNALLQQGAIDHDTYARASAEAFDRMLADSREWSAGVRRALRNFGDDAGDMAKTFEDATTSALRASEDAFVQWARTGKISATDLFNTIAEEALRTAYRMLVLKPLSGFLEGLIGNISFDLFGGSSTVYAPSPLHNQAFGLLGHAHQGGMVGGPNAFDYRPVPLAAFADAPRFHGGGLVGHGEVPIVAKQGEVIGWPEQMRRAFGSEVVVQIIDQRSSGAQPEVTRERGPDGRQVIRVLIREEVGRGLAQGWWDQTMGSAYGLNRRGVPR
ncbi:MAG: hypothetical protein KIT00_09025 [Rhodospirillales bacterium]|nr:hypothetical protein [Rhodospirillales bacterium]